jgi:hypothetical protein
MEFEKPKKSTKSIKEDQYKATVNTRPNRTWIMLDAVVFLILMLLVSSALILISSAPRDADHYFTHYHETDEYLENSMEMVLSSTVPKATYRDINGFETEFVDQSIENLILIDLSIRSLASDDLNSTSLEYDLEHELVQALDMVIGSDQDFVFTCSYARQTGEINNDNSIIFITNLDEPYNIKENAKPSFEKHLLASGSDNGNRSGDEVIIRIYFV